MPKNSGKILVDHIHPQNCQMFRSEKYGHPAYGSKLVSCACRRNCGHISLIL